jgi:Predicted transcriptional regulators
LKIIVSNRSAVPIYEQIKEQIREAVFSGELKSGDALPSIRQLAKDLKVSVITTTRAYTDLQEEGFVVNRQGKGCFVLPQSEEMAKEAALVKIEENLRLAVSAAKNGNILEKEVLEILKILYEEE